MPLTSVQVKSLRCGRREREMNRRDMMPLRFCIPSLSSIVEVITVLQYFETSDNAGHSYAPNIQYCFPSELQENKTGKTKGIQIILPGCKESLQAKIKAGQILGHPHSHLLVDHLAISYYYFSKQAARTAERGPVQYQQHPDA